MINLVSLLVAAALVSLQCGFEAYAQIERKNDLDNTLQPNVVPTKRRTLRPFVKISGPPPKSVRIAPGTRAELVCEVIGNPAPNAQWLKNGEPTSDYDEVNEIISIHPSSLARLTSKMVVTAADNGDEYTCVGTAGLKQKMATTTVFTVEDEDEANIFTLEDLFRKPSKPVIIEFYNEIFQDIGSSAVLPCRYHSTGKTEVFWLNNRDELVYGNSRVRILPTGDLLLTNIRWEDMGNYTCTAKNHHGEDSATTFLYPIKKQ